MSNPDQPEPKPQGLCLVGREGSHYMKSDFDGLPPATRELLSNSRYNICPACFRRCGGGRVNSEVDRWLIGWFEAAIEGREKPPDPMEAQRIIFEVQGYKGSGVLW